MKGTDHYEFTLTNSNTGISTIKSYQQSGNVYTIGEFDPGTKYFVYVTPVINGLFTASSATATFLSSSSTAPGLLIGPVLSGSGSFAVIKFNGIYPSEPFPNQIAVNDNFEAAQLLVDVTPELKTIVIGPYTDGLSYRFQITPVTITGGIYRYGTTTSIPTNFFIPGPPGTPQFTNITASNTTVSFSVSADTAIHPTPDYYQIAMCTSTLSAIATLSQGIADLSTTYPGFSISGLSPSLFYTLSTGVGSCNLIADITDTTGVWYSFRVTNISVSGGNSYFTNPYLSKTVLAGSSFNVNFNTRSITSILSTVSALSSISSTVVVDGVTTTFNPSGAVFTVSPVQTNTYTTFIAQTFANNLFGVSADATIFAGNPAVPANVSQESGNNTFRWTVGMFGYNLPESTDPIGPRPTSYTFTVNTSSYTTPLFTQTISGLTNGTSYFFTVKGYANSVFGNTLGTSVNNIGPTAPTSLTATNISGNTITLSLGRPLGGTTFGYKVAAVGTSTTTIYNFSDAPSDSISFVIPNLDPQLYTFVAYTQFSLAPNTSTLSVSSEPYYLTGPFQPTNTKGVYLGTVSGGITTVNLTLTASWGGGPVVSQYNISDNFGNTYSISPLANYDLQYNFNNLSAYLSYSFTITPFGNNTNGTPITTSFNFNPQPPVSADLFMSGTIGDVLNISFDGVTFPYGQTTDYYSMVAVRAPFSTSPPITRIDTSNSPFQYSAAGVLYQFNIFTTICGITSISFAQTPAAAGGVPLPPTVGYTLGCNAITFSISVGPLNAVVISNFQIVEKYKDISTGNYLPTGTTYTASVTPSIQPTRTYTVSGVFMTTYAKNVSAGLWTESNQTTPLFRVLSGLPTETNPLALNTFPNLVTLTLSQSISSLTFPVTTFSETSSTTTYTGPLNTPTVIITPSTSTVTVTVTVIGGGGGGKLYGGASTGGAGGVATYTITGIALGTPITYFVGAGGAGSFNAGNGGYTSYVTIGNTTVYAGGGGGAGVGGSAGGNGIGQGGGTGGGSDGRPGGNGGPGSISPDAEPGNRIGVYGNGGVTDRDGTSGVIVVTFAREALNYGTNFVTKAPTVFNSGLPLLFTWNSGIGPFSGGSYRYDFTSLGNSPIVSSTSSVDVNLYVTPVGTPTVTTNNTTVTVTFSQAPASLPSDYYVVSDNFGRTISGTTTLSSFIFTNCTTGSGYTYFVTSYGQGISSAPSPLSLRVFPGRPGPPTFQTSFSVLTATLRTNVFTGTSANPYIPVSDICLNIQGPAGYTITKTNQASSYTVSGPTYTLTNLSFGMTYRFSLSAYANQVYSILPSIYNYYVGSLPPNIPNGASITLSNTTATVAVSAAILGTESTNPDTYVFTARLLSTGAITNQSVAYSPAATTYTATFTGLTNQAEYQFSGYTLTNNSSYGGMWNDTRVFAAGGPRAFGSLSYNLPAGTPLTQNVSLQVVIATGCGGVTGLYGDTSYFISLSGGNSPVQMNVSSFTFTVSSGNTYFGNVYAVKNQVNLSLTPTFGFGVIPAPPLNPIITMGTATSANVTAILSWGQSATSGVSYYYSVNGAAYINNNNLTQAATSLVIGNPVSIRVYSTINGLSSAAITSASAYLFTNPPTNFTFRRNSNIVTLSWGSAFQPGYPPTINYTASAVQNASVNGISIGSTGQSVTVGSSLMPQATFTKIVESVSYPVPMTVTLSGITTNYRQTFRVVSTEQTVISSTVVGYKFIGNNTNLSAYTEPTVAFSITNPFALPTNGYTVRDLYSGTVIASNIFSNTYVATLVLGSTYNLAVQALNSNIYSPIPITTYTTPTNTILTVSGGATSSVVTVTVIGGGGGGKQYGGTSTGGAGAVAAFTFTGITLGTPITYFVGAGGVGSFLAGNGGYTSYVTIGNTTVYAGGGGGAGGAGDDDGGNGIGQGGGTGGGRDGRPAGNGGPGSISPNAQPEPRNGVYGFGGTGDGGNGSNGVIVVTEYPANNTGVFTLATVSASTFSAGFTGNTILLSWTTPRQYDGIIPVTTDTARPYSWAIVDQSGNPAGASGTPNTTSQSVVGVYGSTYRYSITTNYYGISSAPALTNQFTLSIATPTSLRLTGYASATSVTFTWSAVVAATYNTYSNGVITNVAATTRTVSLPPGNSVTFSVAAVGIVGGVSSAQTTSITKTNTSVTQSRSGGTYSFTEPNPFWITFMQAWGGGGNGGRGERSFQGISGGGGGGEGGKATLDNGISSQFSGSAIVVSGGGSKENSFVSIGGNSIVLGFAGSDGYSGSFNGLGGPGGGASIPITTYTYPSQSVIIGQTGGNSFILGNTPIGGRGGGVNGGAGAGGSVTYTTPTNTILTVPGGATSSIITVTVIGGGGGSSPYYTSYAPGGNGAVATYTFINLTLGTTITYFVGRGGTYPSGGGWNSYVIIGSTKIYAGGGGGANLVAGSQPGQSGQGDGGGGSSGYGGFEGSISPGATVGTRVGTYGNGGFGINEAGTDGVIVVTEGGGSPSGRGGGGGGGGTEGLPGGTGYAEIRYNYIT
jgi:hypothetical protein